jgi:hypothetical protein
MYNIYIYVFRRCESATSQLLKSEKENEQLRRLFIQLGGNLEDYKNYIENRKRGSSATSKKMGNDDEKDNGIISIDDDIVDDSIYLQLANVAENSPLSQKTVKAPSSNNSRGNDSSTSSSFFQKNTQIKPPSRNYAQSTKSSQNRLAPLPKVYFQEKNVKSRDDIRKKQKK